MAFYVALTDNSEAFASLDFENPLPSGLPEQRYLNVMENIADSLEQSDLTAARQQLQGLTGIQGSRIRSGGFPARPEVLFPFVEIKTIEPLIANNKLLPEDQPIVQNWASLITDIVQNYRNDDRDLLAQAANQLTTSIEDFKTRPKLYRIPERLKQKNKQHLHLK